MNGFVRRGGALLAAIALAAALAATSDAKPTTTHFTGSQVLTAIFDRGTTKGGVTHVDVGHALQTDIAWLQGVVRFTGNSSAGSLHGTFDLDIDEVDGGFAGHWHGKRLESGGFFSEGSFSGYGQLEGFRMRFRLEGSFSGGDIEGDVYSRQVTP